MCRSCEALTLKWNFEPRPPRRGRTVCHMNIGHDPNACTEGGASSSKLVSHEVVGLPSTKQDAEKENEEPDKRMRSISNSPREQVQKTFKSIQKSRCQKIWTGGECKCEYISC